MRADIIQDEWWPVLMIEEGYDAVEIPDALYERYKAALAEWDAVQKELQTIREPAIAAKRSR